MEEQLTVNLLTILHVLLRVERWDEEELSKEDLIVYLSGTCKAEKLRELIHAMEWIEANPDEFDVLAEQMLGLNADPADPKVVRSFLCELKSGLVRLNE